MGAYLYYRLKDGLLPEQVNDSVINRFGDVSGIVHFWDEKDIDIEKKKEHGVPDFYKYREGSFKISSYSDEERELFIKSIKYVRERYGKDSIVYDPLKSDSMKDREDWIADIIDDNNFFVMQDKYNKWYEQDRKYINSCKRYNNKTIDEVGCVFVAKSYSDSKICISYGNVSLPEFMKYNVDISRLHYKNSYIPLERTKDGAAIMLIPLQTLDGKFPQNDGSIKTVYDILKRMSDMGVMDNPYRLAARLYKRAPTLMALKEIKKRNDTYDMTMPEIDLDRNYIKNTIPEEERYDIEESARHIYSNLGRYKKERNIKWQVLYLVMLNIIENNIKKKRSESNGINGEK